MKTRVINNFARGMADDRFSGFAGEFSIAKHFDILTNPRRLQPMRGMEAHTTGTGIGALMVATDGLMYGIGDNQPTNSSGKLWKQPSGYGASDNFTTGAATQLSGANAIYDFLVDYPGSGNSKTIYWAGTNTLVGTNKAFNVSTDTTVLNFSTIGQGLVHPKDTYLYFPYHTGTASYIARMVPNATTFTGLNATAITLPSQYRVYNLTTYGDYLAIPATSLTSTVGPDSAIVYLSNRDITLTQFDASIPWGNGVLKVLNNLGGVLVGISEVGSDFIQSETTQDFNSIMIRVYDGGAEPTLVKEIKAFHLAATSRPSVVINHRVNFIYKNRLYFSITVNPNDGIQPSWHGLWSVGRNKLTGEWAVNLERMPVNDGSDTGVLAAVIVGDYVEMVHSAVGTLVRTKNGITSSTTYAATSVYESLVNPQMEEDDKPQKKKLYSVTAEYLPLPTGATVTMKYRVDSVGDEDDWVTIFTESEDGVQFTEATRADAAEFNDGRNYEFRLESTGGAVITAFTYKYDIMETNI